MRFLLRALALDVVNSGLTAEYFWRLSPRRHGDLRGQVLRSSKKGLFFYHMARLLRIELAGGLYHVTARGDRREEIDQDDQDRKDWLAVLGEVCRRFNWR